MGNRFDPNDPMTQKRGIVTRGQVNDFCAYFGTGTALLWATGAFAGPFAPLVLLGGTAALALANNSINTESDRPWLVNQQPGSSAAPPPQPPVTTDEEELARLHQSFDHWAGNGFELADIERVYWHCRRQLGQDPKTAGQNTSAWLDHQFFSVPLFPWERDQESGDRHG